MVAQLILRLRREDVQKIHTPTRLYEQISYEKRGINIIVIEKKLSSFSLTRIDYITLIQWT